MILYNLKKLNNPELWRCFKVGYAADDGVSIVDAGEVYFNQRQIKKSACLTVEHWRALTLSYLKASVDAHQGGPWPQYGFSGGTVIPYPDAIGLVASGSDLGNQIIERHKMQILRLIDDISLELGESCEESH